MAPDINGVTETGMAMLEVGLLSGFILAPDAAAPAGPIMKVELAPGRVSLYLDSVSSLSAVLLLSKVTVLTVL